MNRLRLRLHSLLLVAALFAPAALPAGAQETGELIKRLLDASDAKDPEARRAAIVLMGAFKLRDPAIIKILGERYGNTKEPPMVQRAAHDALQTITDKDFKSPKEFNDWWYSIGQRTMEEEVPSAARFQQQQAAIGRLEQRLADLQKQMNSAGDKFQLMLISSLVVNFLFLVIIMVLGGIGGSRVKAMREITRQAERYIAAAEEVQKRFDGIASELVAKKTEILEFFRKMKEEHQAEIERYAELLEQNMEHRMREETMGLRQKGEKELQETLQHHKAGVNDELQRLASSQKDGIAAEFRGHEKRLLQEVEAQTLFLEASITGSHGAHEAAVKAYRRVIDLKPQHHLAWTGLGTSLRHLARYEEAHEAYRKALELSPGNPHILYQTAATFARQRRRDKMLESLTQCFQNDGELKDEALNDPAFRDYWQDPAFKDLAEA